MASAAGGGPLAFNHLIEPLPRCCNLSCPSSAMPLQAIFPHGKGEIKGAVLTRLVLLALRSIWSDVPDPRLRE